jgi:hypothetical protein
MENRFKKLPESANFVKIFEEIAVVRGKDAR